ncbi:MAG: hypothetical protein HQL46_02550 [Gammaproteobacteria bacterium]|nr:hypothetical protein [Gammaproteobacteria bacterium]
MKNELRQYADNYEAEVLAYENLESDEFIKQFIDINFSGDQDESDILISEYFDVLEIQFYKNEEYDYGYFEICLTYGGPNVYLNVNTRWKSVEYHIGW